MLFQIKNYPVNERIHKGYSVIWMKLTYSKVIVNGDDIKQQKFIPKLPIPEFQKLKVYYVIYKKKIIYQNTYPTKFRQL
jgi:hypothetical protein